MRTKIYLAPLLAVMLMAGMAGVFAAPQFTTDVHTTDIRVSDGDLMYLGIANSFTSSSAHLNAWHDWIQQSDGNIRYQGKGTFELTAYSGKTRMTLNLNMVEDCHPIYETHSRLISIMTAKGTFWIKGTSPRAVSDRVIYDYNKRTGEVSVYGEGDVKFRINGMQA